MIRFAQIAATMYPSGQQKSENLVESARQAREERALKRRKESAAIIVQAAFRGYLTRYAK